MGRSLERVLARNKALLDDLSRVDWWENSSIVNRVVKHNRETLSELGGNLDFIFPVINTKEDEKSVVLSFDVPGTERSTLEVVLEDGKLRITGQRRDTQRKYRSYSPLPPNVDPSSIVAKYEDGVLYLRMTKLASEGSKKIKVN